MRGKDTLENLIQKVHEMSVNYHDEIIPVREMEFESLDSMWIGGDRVRVLPSAQRLLSIRLRIPYKQIYGRHSFVGLMETD